MKTSPKPIPAAVFKQIEEIGKYFSDPNTEFDISVLIEAKDKLVIAHNLAQGRYFDLFFAESPTKIGGAK